MTAFKHLFLFSHRSQIQEFLRTLESKARFTVPDRGRSSYRGLEMAGYDGQHEITLATVQDIEAERFRGRNFDKVSIHETVELTHHIHTFVQLYVGRSNRVPYGNLGSLKILVDERVSPDRMYFLRDEFVDEAAHIKPEIWKTVVQGLELRPSFRESLISNLSF